MTPPLLYAVDPSTVATGIAQFIGKRLDRVIVLEADGLEGMLDAVRAYLYGASPAAGCIVETPVIYGHRDSGVRADGMSRKAPDPNDLIKIAQVAGAVRAHFAHSEGVTPSGWNGGRPKKVTEARIKSLLLPEELAMLASVRSAVRHNAYDAVGVGMWKLKTLLR